MSDFADLVVAAGDAVVFFFLGDVDFVGAEFGIPQHVDEDLEDIVEVGLQAGEADGGGVWAAAGFDFRGADFKEVVELIAGLGLGAAGAPDFAVDIDQAGFGGGLVDASRRGCGRCRRSEAVRDLPAGRSPCRWTS